MADASLKGRWSLIGRVSAALDCSGAADDTRTDDVTLTYGFDVVSGPQIHGTRFHIYQNLVFSSSIGRSTQTGRGEYSVSRHGSRGTWYSVFMYVQNTSRRFHFSLRRQSGSFPRVPSPRGEENEVRPTKQSGNTTSNEEKRKTRRRQRESGVFMFYNVNTRGEGLNVYSSHSNKY